MNKAIKITLTIYFASSLFLLLFVFELLVPTMEAKLIGLSITMVTVSAVYLLYRVLRNPFRYPYFEQAFDVSNKRNVNIEDWIDRFLINERNWEIIKSHSQRIEDWKREQEISRSADRSIAHVICFDGECVWIEIAFRKQAL